MRVNRAGGHTQLQAKHFKMCLRESYPEKEATASPKLMKLVEMVQFMWERRTIPAELGWTILILISKGNIDN